MAQKDPFLLARDERRQPVHLRVYKNVVFFFNFPSILVFVPSLSW
jgi:hypothetical protein